MSDSQPQLRTVHVTRYVTPLREGGSLPAIVEADDEFLYVLKFRGAGQGVKALIAELIAGEIARTLGVSVRTVDTHVDHLRTKLGVRARTQIAVWARLTPTR